jgi:hypothetical protein
VKASEMNEKAESLFSNFKECLLEPKIGARNITDTLNESLWRYSDNILSIRKGKGK